MSALTSYRVFQRTAAGFDGATAEATGIYTQLRNVFSTDTTTTVGSFSPASLNRYNVVSLMRIALSGVINPGDEIRVRDALGGVRFTRPASVQSSGWFLVLPDDVIEIEAPDATAADIIVDDLTDPQLLQAAIVEINGGGIIPPAQTSITVDSATVLPAYNGHLIVFAEAQLPAYDLTLPALADVELDSRITFIRVRGAESPDGEIRVITDAVPTEVNGLSGVTDTAYFLRSDQESTTYLRVPEGWARRQGFQAPQRITDDADPIVLPAWQEGTLYLTDQGTVDGNVTQLPQLIDCRQGCRLVILANSLSAGVHELTAAGLDPINGKAGPYLYACGQFPVIGDQPVRPVVIVEHAVTTWIATAVQVPTSPGVSITAAGTIPPRGGMVFVSIDLAVDGDVTLPAISSIPVGTQLVITRGAGAGTPRIITPGALVEVNGVAGIVETQYFLRSIGDSITYRTGGGGWTRPMGDQAPAELTAAGNPLNLDAVKGGFAHILDAGAVAGNVTALPLLADVPEGAGYLIRNTDSNLHVVDPSGAELISGVANRQHQRGEVMYVESSPSGWLALGGGNQGVPVVSAANLAPTAVQLSGNITPVSMTGGAGQSVTLPPVAQVATGSMVVVFNSTAAAAHQITPTGADLIDGVNAAVNDAAGDRTLVISGGPAIGWLTILSA